MEKLSRYCNKNGQAVRSEELVGFVKGYAKTLQFKGDALSRLQLAEGFTLLDKQRIPTCELLVSPKLVNKTQEDLLLWGATVKSDPQVQPNEVFLLGLPLLAQRIIDGGGKTPWAVRLQGEGDLSFSGDMLREFALV